MHNKFYVEAGVAMRNKTKKKKKRTFHQEVLSLQGNHEAWQVQIQRGQTLPGEGRGGQGPQREP